jgi:hypothetical protein
VTVDLHEPADFGGVPGRRHLYEFLTEGVGALPPIGEVQTAPVIRVLERAGRRP